MALEINWMPTCIKRATQWKRNVIASNIVSYQAILVCKHCATQWKRNYIAANNVIN